MSTNDPRDYDLHHPSNPTDDGHYFVVRDPVVGEIARIFSPSPRHKSVINTTRDLEDSGYDSDTIFARFGQPDPVVENTTQTSGLKDSGEWQEEMAGCKPTNPKDVIGSGKLPMELVPDTIEIYSALAFLEGALKYGRFNWRIAGVRSSIYRAALRRHLAKWWNGEDADPKTKVPHLASILACTGILLDAELCGKLEDDRPPRAPMGKTIENADAVIAHLKELFKDHKPKQYTIADGTE